jgi:hypothetical protein
MNEVQSGWVEYVNGFADWVSFWSLTFGDKDRTHLVTRSEAEFIWRRLVQVLNRNLFGNHYTRIVGHSYFSYVLAFEYQKRGVLHIHALVDRVTNWELANRVWRKMAGIIKIQPVLDQVGACGYICKYVTKGGDVALYKAAVVKEPSWKPLWYQEAEQANSLRRSSTVVNPLPLVEAKTAL